jgi:hypothetical protein
MEYLIAVAAVIIGSVGTHAYNKYWSPQARLRRAEFIRTYRWPKGLYKALLKERPGLTRKDCALVSRGLRQFFIAYLMSGKRFVSMPSQVADDLWHQFILYTREYDAFCRRAFGTFLHHTPAVVLGPDRQGNEGLRRVWWYTCKYENIDPHAPTRLPLLFALDAKLNIANGFRYHHNCEELRKSRAGDPGAAAIHCGGDFASTSYDGSTDGLSDTGADSSGGGDGGGDGGGGCGGGGCGS